MLGVWAVYRLTITSPFPLGILPGFQLTTGIDPLSDTLCSLLEYQMMCPETEVRIHIILGIVYN
jgi:hypothetical protein